MHLQIISDVNFDLEEQKAFSVLEVLISVALFGMLITGLLMSLTVLLKVSFKNNLRVQVNNELDLVLSNMQKISRQLIMFFLVVII